MILYLYDVWIHMKMVWTFCWIGMLPYIRE